jgi:4-hydroxy-tetrahydrodipicolinate synthase
VALVTPFTESLDVDYKALKKLLNHTAKGADYYVVLGTTGESPTISDDEKKKILQFIKDNNKKGLPIVYGIGGNNTDEILATIKETDLKGVDAILSVSPYYNKPSQEGIYLHFKKIADKCPVPVILYNIPGRTGSNMAAETTLRLATHKNIIGIKESSGNLEQCIKIAKHMPDDFLLLSGDDMLALPIYSIGGHGLISVLANPFPATFKKIKDSVAAGNYKKAAQELYKLSDLNGAMYEEGNPIGVKYVLSLLDICLPAVRLPHAPASAALRKKIDELYSKI